MINEWQGFAADLEKAYGSDFVADFCKTLTDYQRAEEEMAFSRQQRIAAASERIERSWLDGLGEVHMSLDPEVFFHWVRKLGKDCWSDSGFIREFKRDNPEVIRKTRSRKAMIVRP